MAQQQALFALPPAATEPRQVWTLAQARAALRAQLDAGTTCPCCDQYARRYHRRLNAGMAVALLALIRCSRQSDDPAGWVHAAVVQRWIVDRLPTAPAHPTGELGKLVHWGLVEALPQDAVGDDDRRDTRASGFWRPTALGVLFGCERQRVQSHVYIFNGACQGTDGPWITIDEALGKRFAYSELMGG